jgi:WD40 repeat protein
MKPPGTADYLTQEGLGYSPDGQLLAVNHGLASDSDGKGVLSIFKLSSGKLAQEISEPLGGGGHPTVAFSPDGKQLIRTYDRDERSQLGQFLVYRVADWQLLWSLALLPLRPASVALSSDGRFAAVGGVIPGSGVESRGQIIVIDLNERTVARTFDHVFVSNSSVTRLAWRPNTMTIVAGTTVTHPPAGRDPPSIKIFDAKTGVALAEEAAGSVQALRYTPDGRYLIESSSAEPVRIWDGDHRTLLQEIRAPHAYALAVSRDSKYLAVGDGRHVSVWMFN